MIDITTQRPRRPDIRPNHQQPNQETPNGARDLSTPNRFSNRWRLEDRPSPVAPWRTELRQLPASEGARSHEEQLGDGGQGRRPDVPGNPDLEQAPPHPRRGIAMTTGPNLRAKP
ncbi:unnamed protein product [Arctogadus glacialis]